VTLFATALQEAKMKHALCWAPAALLAPVLAHPAAAQKKYAPGVTDSEIKIGQTMPY
jgi:hypothetical protein